MKKHKIIYLLLAVFLVLCGIYAALVLHSRSEEKRRLKEEEAQAVYVTDMSSIMQIQYDMGNGQIEFERKDGTWYYVPDPDFPLAQQYPEQIADSFKKLKAQRELKNADPLETYGLLQPSYTVTLTDAAGKETTLYYGNSVSEGYYVTVDDTKKVYLVSSTTVEDLSFSLEEMAQYDTFPSIGSGNLEKAEFTDENGTRQYNADNTDDVKAMAAIAGGLGVVDLNKVADYSVAEEDLSNYGLGPDQVVTARFVYTEDEEEKDLSIYMGNTDGNGGRYFMINDSDIVYIVSEEICSNILYSDTNS